MTPLARRPQPGAARRSARLVFAVLSLGPCCIFLACGDDGPTGPPPVPEELSRSSAHFRFVSTTELATQAEMGEGLLRAEALYEKIAAIVGPELIPSGRITVHLDGDVLDQGPYVDFDGVHLFRYSAAEDGYWALIAHELVHAFGVEWFIRNEAWNWSRYRFFDEGFADFIAQLVDPEKRGFPFYGFPEDVVVGDMVTSGWHIAPEILRRRHDELNQPCEMQAYPERASWFRYVDEIYGRTAVRTLAHPPGNPTSALVETLIGVSLEQIDAGWEEWIAARYTAIPDAHPVAQAYRERTPWTRYCTEGVDY